MRKIIFLLLILTTWLAAQDSALVARLVALPGVAVKTVHPDSGFNQAFEIDFTQPVDHNRPYGAQFKQRIIISHLSVNRPVVLITEGYNFYSNHTRELSRLLQANEIRVEHRFFGESKPDSMDWRYLTIEQAAADHHRIVQIFKKIYPKQWINTGWSKGGQTSIFHRYFYPNDVAATVAYDAPLNLQKEEKRIDRFFGKVGTAYCRQRLKAFQRTALKRKNQLLPLFKQFAQQKHYDYSIGLEAALEYAVLEYPFSFWQYYKIECDSIPDSTASAECIFNHLKRVVALSSYNDHALNSPAMYQFFHAVGLLRLRDQRIGTLSFRSLRLFQQHFCTRSRPRPVRSWAHATHQSLAANQGASHVIYLRRPRPLVGLCREYQRESEFSQVCPSRRQSFHVYSYFPVRSATSNIAHFTPLAGRE